jgi:hypothetical protein
MMDGRFLSRGVDSHCLRNETALSTGRTYGLRLYLLSCLSCCSQIINGGISDVLTKNAEDGGDDEALLRSLVQPEEDRRRLHPELPRSGGCRWFRSANVIPMEKYRERIIPARKNA